MNGNGMKMKKFNFGNEKDHLKKVILVVGFKISKPSIQSNVRLL